VHLIPNAWAPAAPLLSRAEARAVLDLPAEGFVIGWVGRLGLEKGTDTFVDALATMGDLPVVASIIGEGQAGGPLRARTGPAWPGPVVHWHGLVKDASRYFAAFDLYVLSSRTEGTPISLLEALAASVPTVATTVGGVPDVTGPDGALLVPPGDAGALAAAMRTAISDRAAAGRRASRAVDRVATRYAAEPWLDAHDALYQTLLPGSR
jgi:glycosyltransferase involved in cell wall biosynthesis